MESPTSPTVDTSLLKEVIEVSVETKPESPCTVDEETTVEENSNPVSTVVSLCTESTETDKTNSVASQVTHLIYSNFP